MEPKLISIKDLITNSWNLYFKNFKKLLLPIAIMIPVSALGFLTEFVNLPEQKFFIVLFSAISIFVGLWTDILLIEAIAKIFQKQEINYSDLLYSSMKKIASYFWVSILTGLAVISGFILLIIPGIIFAVWFGFADYMVILEDKKGISALKASKDLVAGRWGSTFWRLILPTILFAAAATAIALILTYIANLGNLNLNLDAITQNIAFNIIYSLIFTILSPLFSATGVILYYSLKETKKQITQ